MKENRIRRVIAEGGVAIGTLITEFGTKGIARILEFAGVDFVTIDMEHGAFDIARVAELIAAFKATDIAPVVRVPEQQYHFIARALDAGALCIQVPNVHNAAAAREIVACAKYPPRGKRGFIPNAPHTEYRRVDAAYIESANKETMIIVQIESEEGLENLDEIAAVDGIDVLAIGHGDLSLSMGIFGQLHHPRFQAAVTATVAAALKHNKIAKIHPHSDDDVRKVVRMGYRMLMSPMDVVIFRKGAKDAVDGLRKAAASA